MSCKVPGRVLIMTFPTCVSRPNYVPAVAVIRWRLVLVVLSRFKGYLDGYFSPKRVLFVLEFYERGGVLMV